MVDHEESNYREHFRELRRAARGIGHDLKLDAQQAPTKIEKKARKAAKEARYAVLDLEDDLANAGRTAGEEIRKVPGAVASGAVVVGRGIETGVVGGANAAREAAVAAGKATKEASKNTFARMAGVNRKPIREWRDP